MPEPHTLALFSGAVVLFAIIPGPAVLYVVTRSVSQGRSAGVVSAAAMQAGSLVHVLAAALSLSAILAASATVFHVVKILGAAYLVWLGVQALRRPKPAAGLDSFRPEPLRRVFIQGAVVAVLNPKTSLFFIAFLPQFVDPSRGLVPVQTLVLGVLLMIITCLSDSTYAIVSGSVGNWLRRSPRSGRLRRFGGAQRLVTGAAYISLGVLAAFADPKLVSE